MTDVLREYMFTLIITPRSILLTINVSDKCCA